MCLIDDIRHDYPKWHINLSTEKGYVRVEASFREGRVPWRHLEVISIRINHQMADVALRRVERLIDAFERTIKG